MRSTTPVAVAIFIIITGNELYKIVIDNNASPSIKGGKLGVIIEVAGENFVLGVVQDGR